MNRTQINGECFNGKPFMMFIRLAWRKQLNPDIKGFKILTADTPYGTYTQIADITKTIYIFRVSRHLTYRKWVKVIPYTDRGELSPLIFKSYKITKR